MLMIFKWSILFYLFYMGIISFILNRKHLLSSLLSLEFIVLTLFFILMMYLNSFNYETYFSMMFLTFSVCEGALGISVMVSMIRTHGNDYFYSFSILQC